MYDHKNDLNRSLKSLTKHSRVEMAGEFGQMAPWKERKKMKFDPKIKCFKVTVQMKIGDRFKFLLNN